MNRAAAGLALVVSACGHTELHEAVLRPTTGPTAKVDIYLVEQSPNRPFYEVALVEAFGYGDDAEIEDLSAALQTRGRQLGCDAIVKVHFDMGRSMAHAYGVCVKWSEVATDTIQLTRPSAPAKDAGAQE